MSRFMYLTKKEAQKHVEEIYELIAGHDAINRFKAEDMIDYIKALNEQIAEWQELDAIVQNIKEGKDEQI